LTTSQQLTLGALLMLGSVVASAQSVGGGSGFGGPGIISNDSGVGQRAGRDMALTYFGRIAGVSDNGFTPFQVDGTGAIRQPGTLYGVELSLGAYGRKAFRRSTLGIDFSGSARHYPNGSAYDASNQQLVMEYNMTKSNRTQFNLSQTLGSQNFGTGFSGATFSGGVEIPIDSTSLLFDNRMSYAQTGFTASHALTGRTTVSAGGSGYTIQRSSQALIGVKGYTLRGQLRHRQSRKMMYGMSYQHMHFDFAGFFGESDIDMMTADFGFALTRRLQLGVATGVFFSQVQGVRRTALPPDMAALLGIPSVATVFYQENFMPMATAQLQYVARSYSLQGQYARSVTPGNGVYLTSRVETFGANYSYNGLDRWSFSLGVFRSKLDSIGQGLVPFGQTQGNLNASYRLSRTLQLTSSYSRRFQDLRVASFPRESTRLSIGVAFSPSPIPISFR
jgi:hypothetical protein